MASAAGAPASTQELRFCRAPDGVRLAYATHGSGPPLVIASCWLSHLEYDWQSPVWRHFLTELGDIATVTRYDERGYGLSDWDVEDLSLEARVADLESIVNNAGIQRFALMGMSQGGPVAIEYVTRHPEKISRLVLYGSYAGLLRDPTPQERELHETYLALTRVGWARPDGTFRRVFTSLMIPGATEEQMRWVDALQRMSTSADNAVRARREREKVDVTSLLDEIDVPTLILHSRGDRMIAFEQSRHLAARIRGSRIVPLESDNRIVLADEPAWREFMGEMGGFLRQDSVLSSAGRLPTLSPREVDILVLAAQGRDNGAIAGALHLSVRTVERHLQNVYVKLGVSGKAARTAAVARFLSRR